MNSIFVYWTKPYLYKNNSIEYNSDKHNWVKGVDLLSYEVEYTKTSALSASKYVGKSILYTDSLGYEVFKKYNLLECYDEINVDLLNEFTDNHTFDAGTYWTSGKTYVICNQKEPFIFLDLDFILLEKVDYGLLKNYDLIHNQWELSRNELYVSNNKFKQLDLPYYYPNNLYPNTSFLYVNNITLLKEYWELHKKIIYNTEVETGVDTWLLADQGILGYIARFMKLNIGCLEECAYISNADDWKYPDGVDLNYGGMPYKVYLGKYKSISIKYYHVWLHKVKLIEKEEERTLFSNKMNTLIKNLEKGTTLL